MAVWKTFVFECGWCEGDNLINGEQTGFWGNRYEVPAEWWCDWCGGLVYTPEGPWTEY